MKDKLLGVGIIGTVVAALCCFTPILAWTLSVIGLSGVISYVYRDDVLLPLMVLFLAIHGVRAMATQAGRDNSSIDHHMPRMWPCRN